MRDVSEAERMFPDRPLAEHHRTARVRAAETEAGELAAAADDAAKPKPAPTDLAALVLLSIFLAAATAGGFLIGPAIGFFCLAGSALVAGLILGSG